MQNTYRYGVLVNVKETTRYICWGVCEKWGKKEKLKLKF